MPIVLSVPRPVLPLSSNRLNAAETLRRAKYGTWAGSASGRILATTRPLSVTRISPCRAASRTSAPVRLCNSLIVIVFMCLNVTRFELGCQSSARLCRNSLGAVGGLATDRWTVRRRRWGQVVGKFGNCPAYGGFLKWLWSPFYGVEPAVGIEPTTRSLQNCCSTTELSWHRSECGSRAGRGQVRQKPQGPNPRPGKPWNGALDRPLRSSLGHNQS